LFNSIELAAGGSVKVIIKSTEVMIGKGAALE